MLILTLFYQYSAINVLSAAFQTKSIVGQPPFNDMPRAERQRGFVSVTNSNRVKVELVCVGQEMQAKLMVNATSFYDWIVLGNTGQSQCKTQGDGGTSYDLRIPIMDDSCGTTMVEPGTFENVISIRSHPHLNLILDNDERIVVRCIYGPPKVEAPVIPDLPSTQAQRPQTTESTLQHVPKVAVVKTTAFTNEYIILIIFLVLFLALLFLLCGCIYFLMRRRKVRLERKNKLLMSVPPGSDIGKLRIWWPGKPAISNDTLLSQDYMVSSNSLREPLSVATGYANESPLTSTSGSGDSPEDYPSQDVYIHESKHMRPKMHAESSAGVYSLKSIPEENDDGSNLRSRSKQYRQLGNAGEDCLGRPQMYSQVDYSHKTRGNDGQLRHFGDSSNALMIDGQYGSQSRSMNEVFTISSPQGCLDTASISTLEGGNPCAVGADIVELDSASLSSNSGQKITADVHTQPMAIVEEPPENLASFDAFITIVQQQRGNGLNRLTDGEVRRWRTMMQNDGKLREMVRKAKTLEEFEAISHLPRYENEFSGQKWAIIVQSLAYVVFMRKLNDIIDHQHESQTKADEENSKHSQANGRMYLKKHEKAPAPQEATQSHLELPPAPPPPGQRSEIHRAVSAERLVGLTTTSTFGKTLTRDRSTTEIVETFPTMASEDENGTFDHRLSSASETMDTTPTLNVYVGNVPERSLQESVGARNGRNQDAFYHALPGPSYNDLTNIHK